MFPCCREAVFDELIQEVAEPEEGEPLRHLDIMGFASDLFEVGAKPETLFRNRSVLYEISNALELAAAKRLKKQRQQQGMASGGVVSKLFNAWHRPRFPLRTITNSWVHLSRWKGQWGKYI